MDHLKINLKKYIIIIKFGSLERSSQMSEKKKLFFNYVNNMTKLNKSNCIQE